MAQRVLFIDRDGTLIIEPPTDYQVDSLEKLEFYPKVFQYLSRIVQELDYELVMVTNQDGLGTASFPEATFWPAHNKMMRAFENEGIVFKEVLIDRSFPQDQAPTRKPRTGLLTAYLEGDYDLANSYVLGDRWTDMQLAHNLGAKGIWLQPDDQTRPTEAAAANLALQTTDWAVIYDHLKRPPRTANLTRKTKETQISIALNLDGQAQGTVETGLGFLDHMLDQLVRHAGIDLTLKTVGDLHVDEHHTVEDTALALGAAFQQALGQKHGLARYGFCLPMDESLAQVAIDFGGRPYLVWQADFKRERIGDVPTELFEHFFHSFATTAACTLNIQVAGKNEHHKIEAIFKGWARAVKMALRRDDPPQLLPSTKGVL